MTKTIIISGLAALAFASATATTVLTAVAASAQSPRYTTVAPRNPNVRRPSICQQIRRCHAGRCAVRITCHR